jgi:hypothetical protein
VSFLIIPIALGDERELRSSSLCSCLHPAVTSSLFGPNVFSTLFSNTVSLCSRDQVSQPYRTAGKIIVFYILMLPFLQHYQPPFAHSFRFPSRLFSSILVLVPFPIVSRRDGSVSVVAKAAGWMAEEPRFHSRPVRRNMLVPFPQGSQGDWGPLAQGVGRLRMFELETSACPTFRCRSAEVITRRCTFKFSLPSCQLTVIFFSCFIFAVPLQEGRGDVEAVFNETRRDRCPMKGHFGFFRSTSELNSEHQCCHGKICNITRANSLSVSRCNLLSWSQLRS